MFWLQNVATSKEVPQAEKQKKQKKYAPLFNWWWSFTSILIIQL